jgi:hypothetical protein
MTMTQHAMTMMIFCRFIAIISVCVFPAVCGFQPLLRTAASYSRGITVRQSNNDNDNIQINNDRRSFLSSAAGVSLLGIFSINPQSALAGIDVSGLRSEGGAGGNPSIASQLKAYDGSGSARVKEIKAASGESSSAPSMSKPVLPVVSTASQEDTENTATWAYRAAPAFNPQLSKVGPLGAWYRLNDQIVAPQGTNRRALNIQFEFPSDWLQLDKFNGGIQYVDQRNGDKLYVLRAKLPAETTLASVPKAFFGDVIFNPQGSIQKSGNTVEDYKVSSSEIISQCPQGMCTTRRRLKIKYATVTGNGLRVERRALVDAYEVLGGGSNEVVMLMTSSNAVKFDKKDSAERETVEQIVNSFQVE